MVRHGGMWALDLSGEGLSSSGFWDCFSKGDVSLRTGPPPLLEWISIPPLVVAVLVPFKGAESPGSGRVGVTGWFFFPSEAV